MTVPRWIAAIGAVLAVATASLAFALPYSFTANYANCPDNCGASSGAGSCQGGTCKCSPGHGGLSCGFGADTLYGTSLDNIYSGVIPRRNASRPADASTSLVNRLFQAGGPPPQLVVMAGADRTSALAWGRMLQIQDGGALLSVDDWLPWWHLTHGSGSAKLQWRNPRLAQAGGSGTPRSAALSAPMASFMSTVEGAGLQKWVIPMQAPLHLACQLLGSLSVTADVVHLTSQGLQGYGMNVQWIQSLQECWLPIVAPGGLMLIDTLQPSSGGSSDPLVSADHSPNMTDFALRHNVTLHPASAASPHWVLVKPVNAVGSTVASQLANTTAAGLSTSSSTEHAGASASTSASEAAAEPCDPALAVLPEGWQPCSMGSHIHVDVQGRTVQASFMTAGPWGNLLAPYFQGLAIAQLLNYTYMYNSSFAEDWLAHLPSRVEPGLICPNVTEVVHACSTCIRHDLWHFTMNCPAGWPKARPAIRNVTRGALETWVKATGKVLPQFQEAEAVIQIRCARDTLLGHAAYGPTAFSFFTTHMPKSTKRVSILYARHGHLSPKNYEPCNRLVEALEGYIHEKRPDVEVLIVGGEKWEDWSRLVYAPVAFRECQSSWGLWSIMAGDGLAFSPPLFAAKDSSRALLEFVTPYVDGKFQFVEGAVLYPKVARRANMTTCQDLYTCDVTPQADTIVAWLQEH